MPRAHRGRHRGHHRRPKSHHLPATVGSFALLTAAVGAISVGGPATASAGTGMRSVVVEPLVGQQTVLDPEAVAAALALRSEETVERSTQREQLGESMLQVEAGQAQSAAASLDAVAADRLTRFADQPLTWTVPISGYRLTSMYGPRWGRMHTGLDMAAPTGTPIYAMAGGEVVSAQYDRGYGNRIVLRHEDGTETWYCHQSRFEITSGEVEAGQLIGYVGSTGNSTGPHLHLEIHPGGGDAVNPLTWMRDRGLTV